MTTENSTEISKEDLVGRGARDGAKLFREWFSNLTNVAEARGAAHLDR